MPSATLPTSLRTMPRPITRRGVLSSWLALPLLRAEPRAPAGQSTAFTHLTAVDGSGAALRDSTVVVSGDRISAVGPAASIKLPSGAKVVESRGRFLIPGLCDSHAHLSYFKASALPVLLANGVTSIRDMGGLLAELDRWRTETEQGVRPGPRIFRAGPILNGKQFNEFQVAVTDAAEARGAVRVLERAGADFIKVHAAISRDAYFAVQEECRQHHLPYAGHMPRAITPEEASDAGQLTLEHAGAFADRLANAGIPPNEMAAALKTFGEREAPALFARFAKNKTWFTPTLIASKAALHLADHQPDPRDRYVSASCKKITAELLSRPSYQEFFTPGAIERQKRELDQLLPLVGRMNREGVRLLAGSDFAVSIIYPGFSLHEELELLVAAGLTPMAALQSATSSPAEVLGRTDLGVIKPGNLADLVLLEADPLADIRNTRRIRSVVSRGRVFERAELDQLLADAQLEAANT